MPLAKIYIKDISHRGTEQANSVMEWEKVSQIYLF